MSGLLVLRKSTVLSLVTAPIRLSSMRTMVMTTSRNMAAPAAGGKKGGKGTLQTKKKVFDVETDPAKLVSYCCGLNYKLEGEEVKLKEDSEYPDWLFKMDITRPEPSSEDMEPGTMEYYLRLRKEHNWRWKTLSKLNRKLHKY